MYVDFDSLDKAARVWVYQSDKAFDVPQVEGIKTLLKSFTEQWQSHGASVKASFKIILNQFIILGVDDKGPSVGGCSIDSSVHFIQEIEKKFNLSLLNKSNMAFESKGKIVIFPFNKVKEAIAENILSKEDFYFNNSITELHQIEGDWKQKLENSWVAKYF